MADTDSNFMQLATALGVNNGTLRSWFNVKGRSVPIGALPRLAALLNITEWQALVEAGGVTAEQVRIRVGRERAERFFRLSPGGEADRAKRLKAAAAIRGKKRSAQAIEAIRRGRARTGATQRSLQAMLIWKRSTVGHAVSKLVIRLVNQPSASQRQIRHWAAIVSGELDVCVQEVLEVWAYLLERRRMPRPVGRRSDKARCRAMREVLARTARTSGGRLPRGFWPATGAQFDLNYNVLRQWCIDHRVECGSLARSLDRSEIANVGKLETAV